MIKAVRAYIHITSNTPFTQFTGRLTKTLALLACGTLTNIHGLRGVISPFHVSPLFTPGRREWELGNLVTPYYTTNETREQILIPVELEGEYIVHIGGLAEIVDCIEKGLQDTLKTELAIRFADTIIRASLEKTEDVTDTIKEKNLDSQRVSIYLKGPSKFFNIYTPTRIPKLFPSAPEALMAPYMLLTGRLTLTYNTLINAAKTLGLLVETYYSIRSIKPILVPFKKAKEPGIIGRVTYIIDTNKKQEKEAIQKILATAEIAGIGESRANGFGTTTWITK